MMYTESKTKKWSYLLDKKSVPPLMDFLEKNGRRAPNGVGQNYQLSYVYHRAQIYFNLSQGNGTVEIVTEGQPENLSRLESELLGIPVKLKKQKPALQLQKR